MGPCGQMSGHWHDLSEPPWLAQVRAGGGLNLALGKRLEPKWQQTDMHATVLYLRTVTTSNNTTTTLAASCLPR